MNDIGRRGFMGTGARVALVGPLLGAGTVPRSATAAPSAKPLHFIARSDEFTSWEPWLQQVLHAAHKSRELKRKGWAPDHNSPGTAYLRIYLQNGDTELTYRLWPAGAKPRIEIETQVQPSDAGERHEQVTGDWVGDATRYARQVAGSAWSWTAERAAARKQSMWEGGHPSFAFALQRMRDEYWSARNAISEMRANIRYRRLLLPLAEAVEMKLPMGLGKELEEAELVTLPLLNRERKRIAQEQREQAERWEVHFIQAPA